MPPMPPGPPPGTTMASPAPSTSQGPPNMSMGGMMAPPPPPGPTGPPGPPPPPPAGPVMPADYPNGGKLELSLNNGVLFRML